MIKNERQYRIAKAQARKFTLALESSVSDNNLAGTHSALNRAVKEALDSQLGDLRSELREYEVLRSGDKSHIDIVGLRELGTGLVKARIARHSSQKKLAGMLGLKEQQIQRYEATDYAGASLHRIIRIFEVLDVRVLLRLVIRDESNSYGNQTQNIGSGELPESALAGISPEIREKSSHAQRIVENAGFWPRSVAA